MLGWFPDYPDADDYLSPFLVDGGFFQNGYDNPEVEQARRRGAGHRRPGHRVARLREAAGHRRRPTCRSSRRWVGNNTAVYGEGIEGVEDTLDPAFIFRLWTRQQVRLTDID